MVTIEAPAKINLTMEVLGKRPDGFKHLWRGFVVVPVTSPELSAQSNEAVHSDAESERVSSQKGVQPEGYHEIRSVIQTINFGDSLHFSITSDISITCNMPGWTARQSLVSRAISLLRETTSYRGGVAINLEKNIPLSSGLGGDSSDAAAVLRGLDQLWELGLSRECQLGLAAQLGSDVPFFLYRGTCLMEGRGEKITPLPSLPRQWVIIVIPAIATPANKTKNAYASLKPAHYTDGRITENMSADLRAGTGINPSGLFNTFENVFFAPGSELAVYRDHILKIGASNVHLAGSGPGLFTLLADRNRAEDLFIRLKNQGMRCYLTDTGPAV